jgi:hypothetical protein
MPQLETTVPDRPAHRSRLAGIMPGPRAAAAASACLLLGLGIGYGIGQQRPAMHHAEVRCLSAVGAISCTDDPNAGNGEFGVPRDVAWTDANGVFHEGDRPECLPPTGRGLEGPVDITWVEVEVSGTSWRHVVGVECR